MTERRTLYKVYEITPKHREHGRLIHSYLTKQSAENCMSKSIYRYIKTDIMIIEKNH